MMQRLRVVNCALLCLAATPAPAAEPPPAAQLRADCKAYAAAPDDPDGRRCLAYIQGFLDGAIVANARIAQGVSDEFAKTETYRQRALRTRVRERDRRNPAWYTGICIADKVPIADVARAVIAHLNAAPPIEGETAATAVYAALLARFPCRPAGD